MTFRDAFRRRLRDERRRAGLSQADVAARLGISVQAFGDLERGKSGEWVDNLERVAAAIGTTPASLCAYHSGAGGKQDRHLEARVKLMEAAEDISEEDVLSLIDQISVMLQRRRRG